MWLTHFPICTSPASPFGGMGLLILRCRRSWLFVLVTPRKKMPIFLKMLDVCLFWLHVAGRLHVCLDKTGICCDQEWAQTSLLWRISLEISSVVKHIVFVSGQTPTSRCQCLKINTIVSNATFFFICLWMKIVSKSGASCSVRRGWTNGTGSDAPMIIAPMKFYVTLHSHKSISENTGAFHAGSTYSSMIDHSAYNFLISNPLGDLTGSSHFSWAPTRFFLFPHRAKWEESSSPLSRLSVS